MELSAEKAEQMAEAEPMKKRTTKKAKRQEEEEEEPSKGRVAEQLLQYKWVGPGNQKVLFGWVNNLVDVGV